MSLIERAVHERRRPATATAAIGARPPSVGNLIRPRVQTPSGQRSEISNTPVVPADRCIELDLKQLAASSHLVPRNLRSPLAREISAIKRALEPSITDGREGRPEGPLVVAVTSTNPREGKSFLSLNLAILLPVLRGASGPVGRHGYHRLRSVPVSGGRRSLRSRRARAGAAAADRRLPLAD